MNVPNRSVQKNLIQQSSDANSMYSSGRLALEAQHFTEAVVLLRQAVAKKPNDPVFYNTLGIALHATGLLREAVRMMRIAIAINPGFTEARANLSVLLTMRGEDQSEQPQITQQAIAANQNTKGLALAKEGRFEEANAAYLIGIDLNPYDFALHTNLGNVLTELGRYDEAIPCFVFALCLTSSVAEIYFALSKALRAKGYLMEAIRSTEEGLAIDPRSSPGYVNLGILWYEAGNSELATIAFQKCLSLSPNETTAHIGLATLLLYKGKSGQAIRMLEEVLTIEPDTALIQYNLAMFLLMRGDYGRGWSLFESRWDPNVEQMIGNPRKNSFASPKWGSEDIVGKRILVYWEQGYGDTIQFIRFIPLLAERGARIFLKCQPSLERLISCLTGIAEVVKDGSSIPEVDFHCPLMSLPGRLGTTVESIPAKIPYISAPPEAIELWGKKIVPTQGLRVGIVWAGKYGDDNIYGFRNRHRNLNLSQFEILARVPSVTLFSLQKGEHSVGLRSTSFGRSLIDLTEDIHDFADTAALIANLDLVISVDTSVAHISAAMGKPTWILSRFNGCWRWLENRDDSPWYPTVRLFRQTKFGEWDSVIMRVATALTKLTEKSTLENTSLWHR